MASFATFRFSEIYTKRSHQLGLAISGSGILLPTIAWTTAIIYQPLKSLLGSQSPLRLGRNDQAIGPSHQSDKIGVIEGSIRKDHGKYRFVRKKSHKFTNKTELQNKIP